MAKQVVLILLLASAAIFAVLTLLVISRLKGGTFPSPLEGSLKRIVAAGVAAGFVMTLSIILIAALH